MDREVKGRSLWEDLNELQFCKKKGQQRFEIRLLIPCFVVSQNPVEFVAKKLCHPPTWGDKGGNYPTKDKAFCFFALGKQKVQEDEQVKEKEICL